MKAWILGSLTLLWVSGVALSSPITYDFTVTATFGPLDGDVANGRFTFNGSLISPGVGLIPQTGLLTNLNFTWDGIAYNALTANTGFLLFNPSGSLSGVLFGNFCDAGSCGAGIGYELWYILGLGQFPVVGDFDYSTPSDIGEGTVSFSPALAPIPVAALEPTTLSLLGFGLAGIGSMRWRKSD